MSEFKSSGEFATTWVGGLGLIQGEEIVRCRDCKWFGNDPFRGALCRWFCDSLYDDYDGFCAWGERKEGGE